MSTLTTAAPDYYYYYYYYLYYRYHHHLTLTNGSRVYMEIGITRLVPRLKNVAVNEQISGNFQNLAWLDPDERSIPSPTPGDLLNFSRFVCVLE
jgi:hypothetical protein